MRETIIINTRCPKCGNPLEKSRYASKGNWVTNWRIKCTNSTCDVDTGEQCTLSDVYEAFMYLYLNSESIKAYERKVNDNEP